MIVFCMESSESAEEFFHGFMQVDVHLAKAGEKMPEEETMFIEKHPPYRIKLDLQDIKLTEMKERKGRKVDKF